MSCATASSRCCLTAGFPVEKISLLVGHKGSHVTELVYRKQLRPVVEDGATVMDDLFRPRDR